MLWLSNSSSRQTLLRYKYISSDCYLLGGPVVKALPSNAENAGSTLGWGADIPHILFPKNQNIKNNRSSIVTNSIKTLKMVHIKKIFEKRSHWRNYEHKQSHTYAQCVSNHFRPLVFQQG